MEIETKFNVGQDVFYIEHGNIISGEITNITIKVRRITSYVISVNTEYKVNNKNLTDIECFATPQDLLKHIEKQLQNAKM